MDLNFDLTEADIFMLVRALSAVDASALYIFESQSDAGFKDLRARTSGLRIKLIGQLGDISRKQNHYDAVNRGIDEILKGLS